MPITGKMLITKTEEVIKFLDDKIANNTLTDEDLKHIEEMTELVLKLLER